KNDEAPHLLLPAARARGEVNGNEAARPLYQKALNSLSSRDDTVAIRSLYEELVEEGTDAHYWREGFGEWLAARGEIQVAIAQFRARIDGLTDTHEDRVEAVRLLERMVEIDTFAPELRRSLAQVRKTRGQEDEAER